MQHEFNPEYSEKSQGQVLKNSGIHDLCFPKIPRIRVSGFPDWHHYSDWPLTRYCRTHCGHVVRLVLVFKLLSSLLSHNHYCCHHIYHYSWIFNSIIRPAIHSLVYNFNQKIMKFRKTKTKEKQQHQHQQKIINSKCTSSQHDCDVLHTKLKKKKKLLKQNQK